MRKLLMLVAFAVAAPACSTDTAAMSPDEIQQKYGVTNAYTGTFQTSEGALKGTVVPVKLADGREAQLFIPAQRRDDNAVYIRDEEGFHPVQVDRNLKREDYVRSEQVVTRRAEPAREVTRKKTRSWQKEALIIGGSAGGGAVVGGVAGGKKGAAIGAAAGGVGGLLYDLATRKK